MTTLCDSCFAPGACCQRLHLTSKGEPVVVWSDEPGAADAWAMTRGHPFHQVDIGRTYTDQESGRTYHEPVWGCRALDKSTGRCTIYADRPQLCRDYEPASDALCVHWRGAESGEESIL